MRIIEFPPHFWIRSSQYIQQDESSGTNLISVTSSSVSKWQYMQGLSNASDETACIEISLKL